MEIVNDLRVLNLKDGCVCAIGVFDGVHLGHQAILKKLKIESKKLNLPSALLTFFPHPEEFLKKSKKIKMITTKEQKIKIISGFNLDFYIELSFDEKFSKMRAEEFVKNILVSKLNVKEVIIGENFFFGYKREGNSDYLKKLGVRFGFKVKIVKNIKQNGTIISSTNIRKLLERGKVEKANLLLGRHYSITGEVIKGKGIGKKIGIPTINLNVSNDLLIKEGVFAGYSKIEGIKGFQKAAISIGKNPTFFEKKISVEAHLIEFSKNVYGRKVELFFIKKLRNQVKFKDLKNLKAKIISDIKKVKEFFSYG